MKKRGYGKRKYVRKGRKYAKKGARVLRRLNTGNSGYININRRLDLISVAASAVAGAPVVTPAAQTCLQLGVATPTVGALGTTYDVPFSLTFRLDQLRTYGELTQVFDQYKINAVKIAIRSFANNDSALGFPMPYIEYWSDADSNIPPTVDQSREVMGVKTKYFNSVGNVCYMYVKPKIAAEVTSSGGTASALVSRGWCDCADPGVLHYSIKGIIHNYSLPSVTAGNNNLLWDITQNVSFKEVI